MIIRLVCVFTEIIFLLEKNIRFCRRSECFVCTFTELISSCNRSQFENIICKMYSVLCYESFWKFLGQWSWSPRIRCNMFGRPSAYRVLRPHTHFSFLEGSRCLLFSYVTIVPKTVVSPTLWKLQRELVRGGKSTKYVTSPPRSISKNTFLWCSWASSARNFCHIISAVAIICPLCFFGVVEPLIDCFAEY